MTRRLVAVMVVTVWFAVVRFVAVRFVVARLVVVADVVVELTAVKFWSVEEPVARNVLVMRSVNVPKVERRMDEKKLVEVAADEVEFTAVKFCRVEEPLTKRLASVARPLAKRFVKVPVDAKKLVEVAAVRVAFAAVKFWRVVLPVTERLVTVVVDRVEVEFDALKLPAMRVMPLVEDRPPAWRPPAKVEVAVVDDTVMESTLIPCGKVEVDWVERVKPGAPDWVPTMVLEPMTIEVSPMRRSPWIQRSEAKVEVAPVGPLTEI